MLYRLDEIATALKVSRKTLLALHRAKKIPTSYVSTLGIVVHDRDLERVRKIAAESR
jgi:hypothetical protein